MKRVRDIARVGAALLFIAAPAAADEMEAAPGVAHSTSFLALSPDTAVVVRPLDNSRANLTLKQHFAAALKKRAVRVDETAAPYVLNFETEVDQAIRRTVPSLGSASGGSRESDVRINVWATRQDSVLRSRSGEISDRGILRYVLTVTLDDERTGRRLWQGEASYASAPADEAATMAAMATLLADQFGQTVRQKTFRLE